MPANSKIEQEAVLGTYYLIEAIQQKKFKVAEAMIKMGAATDVQNSYGQSLLESSLVGPMLEPLSTANIEFIKYLFQNGYVTSLEEYSFFSLLKEFEVAKLVVASGLVREADLDEYDKIQYNKAKAKIRAETDIAAIKTAHAGCNSETIEPSFIPKKNVDLMLAYYQEGYKAKFANFIKGGQKEFFDEIASAVTKQLDFYVQQNWLQIHGIAKILQPTFVTSEEDGSQTSTKLDIDKELTSLIGEFVGSDVSWDAESSSE